MIILRNSINYSTISPLILLTFRKKCVTLKNDKVTTEIGGKVMMKEGLMKANFLLDVNILAEGKNIGDDDIYKDSTSYSFTKIKDIPAGYPSKGHKFYFKDLTSFMDEGIEVTSCWFVQDDDESWSAEVYCIEINFLFDQAILLNEFLKAGWFER